MNNYCNGCKTLVNVKNFYKNKSGKNGLRSKCKTCMNKERQEKIEETNRHIRHILVQAMKEGRL